MDNKNIEFRKENKVNILFHQLVEIVGLEIGLIICSFVINFNFLLFQLMLILLFLVYLSQKYNRSVYSIFIDKKNRIVVFKLRSFLILKRTIIIPFEDISVGMKMEWLMTNYNKVFEIKDRNKIRIIIPYTNRLWTKNELDTIQSHINEIKIG